ncbi:MAG: TetR/AcrR family transcriptional regulator [Clostridiales bacterium]|nr:TetR/AcrR family transcriptional regulator [Clostridiales bacterium]
MVTPEQRQARKSEIMKTVFECYCTYGLGNIGIKGIAKACDIASGSLYTYFENVDDMILESTAFYMDNVMNDFAGRLVTISDNIERFLRETPGWSKENYGEAYRFMYQVYSHPKYYKAGQKFFAVQEEQYCLWADQLAPKMGIDYVDLLALIHLITHTIVHYSVFEREEYLKTQTAIILKMYNSAKKKK